jgi:hypothetical protein
VRVNQTCTGRRDSNGRSQAGRLQQRIDCLACNRDALLAYRAAIGAPWGALAMSLMDAAGAGIPR